MRRVHAVAAALSALLAGFVGVWAYFFPESFYDSFPGILGSWVSVDGPFNEHLIRDVGAMYLAWGAASIGAVIWRADLAYRVLGIAWTVFGVLHFAYHALHLEHLPIVDAVGEMIALGVSLLLGILLLIPPRAPRPRSAV
ncbi:MULTISPECIES: hypothetical protein [Microbacterium]|uniref:hypothetical protein n=1 Tax=Microbacterium TaxID=33882 RepID=UPI000D651C6D|nr:MULTISPECIES: hypothetical protein [Microbacterium]